MDNVPGHVWRKSKSASIAGVFLDFVKENKVIKHIVNVKNCTEPMLQEDLEWLTGYFVPKESNMAYAIWQTSYRIIFSRS